MDNKGIKKIIFLFFGAGKRGRYWLKQFGEFGMFPEVILDNNENLWGTFCDGVRICNPVDIGSIFYEYIFVTCIKEDGIFTQLLRLGVDKSKIISGNHKISNYFLYHVRRSIASFDSIRDCYERSAERRILLDLSNGMVLGGVESWSYDLAKKLKRKGHQGLYLTADAIEPSVIDKTYPVCLLKYLDARNERKRIELCMNALIQNLPCTIICNFSEYIFWSACMVKELFPEQIRIVAVQHSDDEPYYYVYNTWQQYIDRWMVISSRIERKLLSYGIKQNKVMRLKWHVPCKETISRVWKKSRLKLGYAGRVTVIAKRIDLLIDLSKILKEREIDFQINIAGDGEYVNTLLQKAQEENLQDYIIHLGRRDSKDIPDFWHEQDIMISCSEFEGHSISQLEAMAEGAVPVITDVSGARDDVEDGYNGFIVDVGDIEALADRICYLYDNPDELEQMGMRAHETVYSRQKRMDPAEFWDDILTRIWRE